MNQDVKKNNKGFPSDYVSKEKKLTDEYAIAYAEAAWQQYLDGNVEVTSGRKAQHAMALQYYNGNQSTYQYLQKSGFKQDEAGNISGYSDVDFTPIGFMKVFMQGVYDYLTRATYDYEARGMDDASIDERTDFALRKRVLMKDKEFFERMMGREITEPIPTSEAEFHIMANETFKTSMEIVLEKHIQAVYEDNRFDLRVEKNLVRDLLYASHFAVYPHYDRNGRIVQEWVDVEEIIVPRSKTQDFSDVPWQGRLQFLTISQLKANVRDRDYKEEEWEVLANTYAGKPLQNFCADPRTPDIQNDFSEPDNAFGTKKYDHFVIPVFTLFYQTTAYNVYGKSINPYNGEYIYRTREFDFEAKPGKESRVEKHYICIHGVSLVLGSKFVFNRGPVTNLVRKYYDKSRPMFPIIITKFDSNPIATSKSMSEALKPIEDMLQLTWGKMINEIAVARPDMTALDLKFIMNGIAMGVQVDDVQEAIDAAFQSGKVVGAHGDDSVWAGRPGGSSGRPIDVVPGGLGSAFRGYVEALQMGFMVMERVIGRSAMTIGQGPHPDTGKKVAEMVSQSANSVLKGLVDAYELGTHNLVEYTAEMVMRLNGARTEDEQFAYRQVFSRLSNDILRAAEGMNLRRMGISIYKRPSQEEINELMAELNQLRGARIAAGNMGGISEDEYFEIRELLRVNPRDARRRLRFRVAQRAAREQAISDRNAEMNAKLQQQSAANTHQMKLDEFQAQYGAEAEAKLSVLREEHRLNLELEKYKESKEIRILELKAKQAAEQSAQDAKEDMALQAVENVGDGMGRKQSTNNVKTQKV